jgi:hypothetical protein
MRPSVPSALAKASTALSASMGTATSNSALMVSSMSSERESCWPASER